MQNHSRGVRDFCIEKKELWRKLREQKMQGKGKKSLADSFTRMHSTLNVDAHQLSSLENFLPVALSEDQLTKKTHCDSQQWTLQSFASSGNFLWEERSLPSPTA